MILHALRRLLDARQLGLKLIANVTYGYTAASFSGRMPCVEVADSIVHKGRQTLQRAIKLVHDTARWQAKVVYGDTDSMFVHLPGRSKAEAFVIGNEIAAAVTDMNPKPVKLKFEKVYYPCVLQTKKRYVGYSYEFPDQQTPTFDAKGIETVRRDTCPAVAKVLEQSLRVLFDSMGDLGAVQEYVCDQFDRLLRGSVSLHEYVFVREYRGRHGYANSASAPALKIARELTMRDARAEPLVKERVPYVIVNGAPGCTLISCVRQPLKVLEDRTLVLNSVYYVTGQMTAALNRALLLAGADVRKWYSRMHRSHRPITYVRPLPPKVCELREGGRQLKLSQFLTGTGCVACGETVTNQRVSALLCTQCRQPAQHQNTLYTLAQHEQAVHTRLSALLHLCRACTGDHHATDIEEIRCISIDCPIRSRHEQFSAQTAQAISLRKDVQQELLSRTTF